MIDIKLKFNFVIGFLETASLLTVEIPTLNVIDFLLFRGGSKKNIFLSNNIFYFLLIWLPHPPQKKTWQYLLKSSMGSSMPFESGISTLTSELSWKVVRSSHQTGFLSSWKYLGYTVKLLDRNENHIYKRFDNLTKTWRCQSIWKHNLG